MPTKLIGDPKVSAFRPFRRDDSNAFFEHWRRVGEADPCLEVDTHYFLSSVPYLVRSRINPTSSALLPPLQDGMRGDEYSATEFPLLIPSVSGRRFPSEQAKRAHEIQRAK